MLKALKRISGLLLAGFMTTTMLPFSAYAADSMIPAVSSNVYDNDYTRWASPIQSYLYQEGDLLVRVEAIDQQLVIEYYDSNFKLTEVKEIELDEFFPLWGGFFAGENYNFVIVGQENQAEDDDTEVIRVIQYSKDWERLEEASLLGANTVDPFEAGSLRCAEYNGMLYIRTSHEMYTNPSDGLNHQANLTFSVRESDMEITDVYDIVMNCGYGYVSHSFNQFILVDQNANLVALDHGDAYPRSAVLMRYDKKAGNSTFSGYTDFTELVSFPGEIGDNSTGASVGGLAETSEGYIAVYNNTDYSGDGGSPLTKNVFLSYTPKNDFFDTETHQITAYVSNAEGGNYSAGTPMLVSTGMNGGYLLWHLRTANDGWYWDSNQICYAEYDQYGNISDIKTATGALSDCQPIVYNGKIVWYVTNESTPVFYTLDDSGLFAHAAIPVLSDVEPDDWYYDAVNYACEKNLMDWEDDCFLPNTAANRGTVVFAVYRLEGSPSPTRYTSLIDIPRDLDNAVDWATDNNIMLGYDDHTFGLNDTITREQFATILYRYAQYKGYDTSASNSLGGYTDASQVSSYATAAMQWANANGLITGVTTTMLAPKSNVTRAEVATILMRFSENLVS